MHGIRSNGEMISSVLLPELLIQYAMKEEDVSYNTAVLNIFGTQDGHSLYFNSLTTIVKDTDLKQKKTGEKTSRRKAKNPRKIVKKI